MSEATTLLWLANLEWHFARLERLRDDPNPRIRHLVAVHTPLYEGYRRRFAETGRIDSDMYEMVMGNMEPPIAALPVVL